MKTEEIIEEKQKNIWISTTGYRIFLELKSLMESPKTIDELINIISNDSHFKKEISKDTIRFDINTLRCAGCEIIRPTKANNYKYEIISHPFKLNISEKELEILLELRENLASKISLNEVFILNDIYEKIASLTFNNELIQNISDSKILADVNKDILKEFINSKLTGKKIQIRYKSPQYGEEDTDIIPIKVLYENKKVYVYAYNFKYDCNSLFECSKILKINSVSINKQDIPIKAYNVIYEVFGDALNDFELKSYEKIIENNNNKLKIAAEVSNEFMFIQHLLLLGRDFKIISPDFFREKLINKIRMIQKRYTND